MWKIYGTTAVTALLRCRQAASSTNLSVQRPKNETRTCGQRLPEEPNIDNIGILS